MTMPSCVLGILTVVAFSHKRLTQQKRQRERERKELDTLNRRNLANVRVVQRNVVYVIGMGSRFAKEEVSVLYCHPYLDRSMRIPAHSNFALERVFRAVRQNLQRFHRQAHSSREQGAGRRPVYHL